VVMWRPDVKKYTGVFCEAAHAEVHSSSSANAQP
jgi:hypothetical protein